MSIVIASFTRMWAIALNTFREAVRNRVLMVLVLFAVGLMAFSLVLGELSMHEEVRVIKDLGLAGISLVGVIIALFLGVNLPVQGARSKDGLLRHSQAAAPLGVPAGQVLGVGRDPRLLVGTMSVILAAFVAAQGGHHGIAMIRAEVLVLFELLLLTAVALVFSSFSSPYLSAMFTGGLWLIGRNTLELRLFATGKLEGTPLGDLLLAIARIVPDFHVFYISGANLTDSGQGIVSIHETFVSWVYVVEAGLYCGLYAGTCLLVAVILFSRRDFT